MLGNSQDSALEQDRTRKYSSCLQFLPDLLHFAGWFILWSVSASAGPYTITINTSVPVAASASVKGIELYLLAVAESEESELLPPAEWSCLNLP